MKLRHEIEIDTDEVVTLLESRRMSDDPDSPANRAIQCIRALVARVEVAEKRNAPPPRCEWRRPKRGDWFYCRDAGSWGQSIVDCTHAYRWVATGATSRPDFDPPNSGRAPDSHDDCNTVEVAPSPKYPTDSHGYEWREPRNHEEMCWINGGWYHHVRDLTWCSGITFRGWRNAGYSAGAGGKQMPPPDNNGAPPVEESPPSPASGVKEIGAGFRLEDRDGILTVWRRGTMLWRCSNPQDASHLRDLASAAARGFAANDAITLTPEQVEAIAYEVWNNSNELKRADPRPIGYGSGDEEQYMKSWRALKPIYDAWLASRGKETNAK